jgi:hypothetical protein
LAASNLRAGVRAVNSGNVNLQRLSKGGNRFETPRYIIGVTTQITGGSGYPAYSAAVLFGLNPEGLDVSFQHSSGPGLEQNQIILRQDFTRGRRSAYRQMRVTEQALNTRLLTGEPQDRGQTNLTSVADSRMLTPARFLDDGADTSEDAAFNEVIRLSRRLHVAVEAGFNGVRLGESRGGADADVLNVGVSASQLMEVKHSKGLLYLVSVQSVNVRSEGRWRSDVQPGVAFAWQDNVPRRQSVMVNYIGNDETPFQWPESRIARWTAQTGAEYVFGTKFVPGDRIGLFLRLRDAPPIEPYTPLRVTYSRYPEFGFTAGCTRGKSIQKTGSVGFRVSFFY